MKRIFGLVAVLALSAVSSTSSAQEIVGLPGGATLDESFFLPCQESTPNLTTHERRVKIQNTKKSPLRPGVVVKWRSSDGDGGEYKLQFDVLSGSSLFLQGKVNPAHFTCVAYFESQPDLIVSSAVRGTSAVSVTLANLDDWTDALPSLARVRLFDCDTRKVVFDGMSLPAPVPHKGTAVVKVPIPATLGPRLYMKVNADATNKVAESNENNEAGFYYQACQK